MNPTLSVQAIDALLPQTQCGKCGHPGCKPYAEGILRGEAINKCPPGGVDTLHALARLLRVPAPPLEQPATPAQVAHIREAECIGCTKCIQACPVDAILGATKLMHTVIRDECSGCELCIAPCPVDCIDLLPLATVEAAVQRQRAAQFRLRHEARQTRLAAAEAAKTASRPQATHSVRPAGQETDRTASDKRLKIEAAMAKVALAKAEKQLARHGTAALAAQVAALRAAWEQAEMALPTTHQAADENALKQARISAAMSRARLTKAERAFGDAPHEHQRAQLAQLRQAAEAAHGVLASLLPPSREPGAGSAALRQAKIELVGRRAELRKAEHQGLDETALASLRLAVSEAEHALHAAEAHCGKPAPSLIRTDKPGLDENLRRLKTDLAYARAELSKLQRRQADADTLAKAHRNVADIERRLHAHDHG